MERMRSQPQRVFPCTRLDNENSRGGKDEPEFELIVTGIFGVRSLSRHHREAPCTLAKGDRSLTVTCEPAESTSRLFGGNSNSCPRPTDRDPVLAGTGR